jgi:SAM-dependent methyltransferase
MKPEEKSAKREYDFMAEHYHNWRTKENPQGWFYNELLEMPATLSLLGEVRGKRLLDFGCGTGIYAKLLTKKGAIVKGFDISPEMIKIAKRENPNLDLKVGSGYKIPFDEKFDIVLASLVVHYLEDWNKMFKEISRVLKTGGYFLFSTGNPVYETRERLKVKGKKYKYKLFRFILIW